MEYSLGFFLTEHSCRSAPLALCHLLQTIGVTQVVLWSDSVLSSSASAEQAAPFRVEIVVRDGEGGNGSKRRRRKLVAIRDPKYNHRFNRTRSNFKFIDKWRHPL